jgi:hypothetical protein
MMSSTNLKPSVQIVAENIDTLTSPNSEAALPPVDISQLTTDQFRAYDIIRRHVEETIANKNLPPLCMIMYGEGGTGKSRVIQTITELFAQKQITHMLKKSSLHRYCGVIDQRKNHAFYFTGFASSERSDDR